MTDTQANAATIPQRWRDELVLALRMRDVPGPRIGEILAEVDEYCADSGLDAETAFGTPTAYAESVAAADGRTRPGVREDLRTTGRTLVGFLGLVVVMACVVDDGPDLAITVGWLVGLAVVLVGSVLTVRTLGYLAAEGWRGMVGVAAVIAATLATVVAVGVLLTTTVATVPDTVAVTFGAVLLVGDAVVGTVRARHRPTADVVSAPGEDPERVRRRNVRADTLAAWLLPAFAVVGVGVLLGMNLLLDRLA
ncbi:hypothetical protein [Cellulomonas sp. Leaf334]|uniref:hypothetical protein n=1 Tax=Cellulomonas sp. Leaf334 TaxID=1736339 RepID=UPI000700211D|nr:hypothetical protein [Cellulomonas sp. Leaf334]KQR10288.1 hypothetical protein ASF78_16440 [Cellulomonas sp. Leaf334]